MFTGIVEEVGRVAAIKPAVKGLVLTLEARVVLEGVKLGDSIAVNGTCLTVTEFSETRFTVDVAPESVSRTNLGKLQNGDPVNLERAVTPSTRLGGHIVQGHVDGTGTLVSLKPDGEALWVTVQASADIMKYVVPKGFICLDGTSLTVVDVWPDRFNIMLVPHTQENIILAKKKPGYPINIEVDIVGKYVEKFVAGHVPQKGVTEDFLRENGFA